MFNHCASHEATELYFYVTSTQSQAKALEPYWRLLERKRAKGSYDHAKALKGLSPYMLASAHNYSREHSTGKDGPAMFPPAVRAQVALEILEGVEGEWSCGNFYTAED